MPKTRTKYVCSNCDWQGPAPMGRCPNCKQFGTVQAVVEEVRKEGAAAKQNRQPIGTNRAQPQKLKDVDMKEQPRLYVPMQEFSRVLGGGLVPGSITLLGGEPGAGKCLTGDTRIFNPVTGDYLPITEFAAKHQHVLSTNDNTLCQSPDEVVGFHDRGIKPIVEVRTRLGNRLRCTPEHPVLTENGWQPIGDLPVGSRVAAPRHLSYFGNQAMPEEEVKLIAYILSDGSANSQISITSMLSEVADDVQQIADYFGMTVRVYDKKNTQAKQYRFVYKDRGHSRQEFQQALIQIQQVTNISWKDWAQRASVSYPMMRMWRDGRTVPSYAELERLANVVNMPVESLEPEACELAGKISPLARYLETTGLRYETAVTKSIPVCIFQLPREQIALFLKILFSCDGSIYLRQGKGDETRSGLSYSTISRQLAEGIQHLLLRFGLVAKVRNRIQSVNGKPYTAYELQILGLSNIRLFMNEIGIYGREEAKQFIMNASLPELPSSRWDTVPAPKAFYEHIIQVAETNNFAEVSRKIGTIIKNRRHGSPITRYLVQKLSNGYPHDVKLRALAYGDVYWDEIESILPAGEEPVYDLTIANNPNFVANGLIVHNSTLMIDAAAQIANEHGTVLYVSGEESPRQIKMRAERLGINAEDLYLLTETNLGNIFEHVNQLDPVVLIVDSIQTVYSEDLDSSPGLVSQVRECASRLQGLAKTAGVTVFMIGHVTKEGSIAGPRVLEHIVDTVMYLEGDPLQQFRLLRTVKNRFGATSEVGVFEMVGSGMVEVPNPSEAFLAERVVNAPGSAIAVTMEGTRPLLVEIQALTNPTAFGNARRTSNGVDFNRLLLLTAVLTKRMGMRLFEQDIFVNVVGGLKIDEPASDLGAAMAIASSYYDRPLPADMAFIGEIGLSGEIRTVNQLGMRLNEAAKIGFKRVVIPKMRRKVEDVPPGIKLIEVHNIADALRAAIPEN